MNKNFILIITFLMVSIFSKGQIINIANEWIATEYQNEDGSPYSLENDTENSIILNFLYENKLIQCINGICEEGGYKLFKNTTLNKYIIDIGGNTYVIQNITPVTLELLQKNVNVEGEIKRIKIIFKNKKFTDLNFTPDTYVAKNGQIVFMRVPNAIEPYFIDSNFKPMDYVFSKFKFPEHKTGGFVIRFVVTKEGEVNGIRVIASSDNKYNDRLIESIKKTKGKWLPGTYNGQKVNIELEYDFDLDFSENKDIEITQADSVRMSDEILNFVDGLSIPIKISDYDFEKSLNQAIKLNPFNKIAYEKLSSHYFKKKKKEKGCETLKKLVELKQQKAIELYAEQCEEN